MVIFILSSVNLSYEETFAKSITCHSKCIAKSHDICRKCRSMWMLASQMRPYRVFIYIVMWVVH